MLSKLTPLDLEGFSTGKDARAHEKPGAHAVKGGVSFAVWAPEANFVSVIGDFNGWKAGASALKGVGQTGVWHGVVEGARIGDRYKYRIDSKFGAVLEKADPYGLLQEMPPKTASIVADPTYVWTDAAWMKG